MAQCQYRNRLNVQCHHEIDQDGLCYWHNKNIKKNTDGVSEQLHEIAKKGHSMEGYSLIRADLNHINLVNHDDHKGYDLSKSDFYHANLEGSHLFHINLSGSSLMKANLTNANLHCANLKKCNLLGAIFTNAKIESIKWGKRIIQEQQAEKAKAENKKNEMLDFLEQAEEIYRNLRKTAEMQGLFEISGRFFYREMVVRRMQIPLFSIQRGISKIADWFCGYGEKPIRVVLFSLALIFICALVYCLLGISYDDKILVLEFNASIYNNFITFLECLYFSVVTFTTLGYGDIVPIGLTRFVVACEAFIGNFTIALFVVVFVKKMTR